MKLGLNCRDRADFESKLLKRTLGESSGSLHQFAADGALQETEDCDCASIIVFAAAFPTGSPTGWWLVAKRSFHSDSDAGLVWSSSFMRNKFFSVSRDSECGKRSQSIEEKH